MPFVPPPFQIESTRQVSAKQGVKIMVYARSGVGKTRLIATCPKPFIMSTENGLLSIQSSDIPYTAIKTLQDIDNVYHWLAARNDGERVQTVALDSITDIADVVIGNELKTQKDPRKAYGEVFTQIMERYKRFRDLPYRHVYFIAQQEMTKDEMTGATYFGPAFPGQKLSAKVPYLFDETFQLMIANDGQRWLRTKADVRTEAKDRSGALDEFEPANLGAIITKIMAHAK